MIWVLLEASEVEKLILKYVLCVPQQKQPTAHVLDSQKMHCLLAAAVCSLSVLVVGLCLFVSSFLWLDSLLK
jgi:hypothetical protein